MQRERIASGRVDYANWHVSLSPAMQSGRLVQIIYLVLSRIRKTTKLAAADELISIRILFSRILNRVLLPIFTLKTFYAGKNIPRKCSKLFSALICFDAGCK